MTQNNNDTTPATPASEREFVIERSFAAPRELVFQVFSECEHLAHWWGPTGWTLPVCQIDFRPGGVWFYCMRGPEGEDSCGKATYQEIIEPERIVYTDAFADAAGNVQAGMPEMLITLTFAEQNGKTKLTSRTQFASATDLKATLDMGMAEGVNETWDRLEAYLVRAVSGR
jgi:uncharacterized protein YndB with AHSA1/START domain